MISDVEYALMAGRAYQATRDSENWFPCPDSYGWVEETAFHKSLDSGFEATYFRRGDEIVISFAGTGRLSSDLDDDLLLGTGVGSQQLMEAAAYYMEVRTANPGAQITLTGHSLGGGLASLISVFFDEQAVTFDQAPFRASANNDIRNHLLPGNVEPACVGLTANTGDIAWAGPCQRTW